MQANDKGSGSEISLAPGSRGGLATVMVYATFPDLDSAAAVGRVLVDERLSACVNLIPGMRSIYSWQGKVEEAAEVVMIAKTRAGLADAAVARIASMHPYDTPAAVILPIEGGWPRYLQWVVSQTGPERP